LKTPLDRDQPKKKYDSMKCLLNELIDCLLLFLMLIFCEVELCG